MTVRYVAILLLLGLCKFTIDLPTRVARAAPADGSAAAAPHPFRGAGTIDPGPRNVSVGAAVNIPHTNLPQLRLSSFNGRLTDGDLINVVIAGSGIGKDRVEIRLRTRPKMWFKGVEGWVGSAVLKLDSEQGATGGTYLLRSGELVNTSLVFVKAKEVGIHRPMYELSGRELIPLLGKRVIFDWVQD